MTSASTDEEFSSTLSSTDSVEIVEDPTELSFDFGKKNEDDKSSNSSVSIKSGDDDSDVEVIANALGDVSKSLQFIESQNATESITSGPIIVENENDKSNAMEVTIARTSSENKLASIVVSTPRSVLKTPKASKTVTILNTKLQEEEDYVPIPDSQSDETQSSVVLKSVEEQSNTELTRQSLDEKLLTNIVPAKEIGVSAQDRPTLVKKQLSGGKIDVSDNIVAESSVTRNEETISSTAKEKDVTFDIQSDCEANRQSGTTASQVDENNQVGKVKIMIKKPQHLNKNKIVGVNELLSTTNCCYQSDDMRGVEKMSNTLKPLDDTNLFGISTVELESETTVTVKVKESTAQSERVNAITPASTKKELFSTSSSTPAAECSKPSDNSIKSTRPKRKRKLTEASKSGPVSKNRKGRHVVAGEPGNILILNQIE